MSSSAIVTTRWTRAAGERREDGDSADSGWVMSHRGDPEFAPWLLGHKVLRGVDAHWPNGVEKWRVGGRGGKGSLVRICRCWRGGYGFCALFLSLFLAQVSRTVCLISLFLLLCFAFWSTSLVMILVHWGKSIFHIIILYCVLG